MSGSTTLSGTQQQEKSSINNSDSEAIELCPVCSKAGASEYLSAPDRLHGRREMYRLVRCPHCTLVWLSSPPKPTDMHVHYTDAYHRLISAGGKDAPERWPFRKVTIEQFKRGGSLLDLGCSSGSFLQFMRDDSWKLYGVEMSAQEARVAERNSGAKVFVGTVADATFEPNSFDVITCFDVLEHLYEPRTVMTKVAEWLKPGGIFYVLVPNIDSAEKRIFQSYWHGLEMPRHLFHYTPRSLTFLAQSVGLRAASVETRRNPAVGTSARYVWHDALERLGIHATPVAYRDEPSFMWKAGRKIARLTVLRMLLALAPLVGGGESIHAVFQRESD